MAYCDKCGAYIPEGYEVCLACGYDPKEAEKTQESAQTAQQTAPNNGTTYSFTNEELKKKLDEQGIEYYPYTSGFFITLKVTDLKCRDEIHAKLMAEHIYTVKVNKGIRIAICSLQLNKIDLLVEKLSAVMK